MCDNASSSAHCIRYCCCCCSWSQLHTSAQWAELPWIYLPARGGHIALWLLLYTNPPLLTRWWKINTASWVAAGDLRTLKQPYSFTPSIHCTAAAGHGVTMCAKRVLGGGGRKSVSSTGDLCLPIPSCLCWQPAFTPHWGIALFSLCVASEMAIIYKWTGDRERTSLVGLGRYHTAQDRCEGAGQFTRIMSRLSVYCCL